MTWKYCTLEVIRDKIIEISFDRGHHCYVGNCYLLRYLLIFLAIKTHMFSRVNDTAITGQY